ncbi:hypothetical protein MSG28_012278 [Choristoneura fumiferana]|uniref:Uncharacterized protein n=1 Tax=Choristoneura fumiferana TaxID=7141 RepID=A0ACC0KCI5_CHOFU|nr:hypothetical protein MSG28_012278 [Choristoneura fumiferana]
MERDSENAAIKSERSPQYTEIAKRLNAIIAQILPFLSQEHQQQVATAVERAKQVTMTELNAIIGLGIKGALPGEWPPAAPSDLRRFHRAPICEEGILFKLGTLRYP